MSLQAELDHKEQSLLELLEVRFERAWSRSRIGSEALSADAGTEFVRARMPAPQPQPTGKPRVDPPSAPTTPRASPGAQLPSEYGR